MKRVLLLLADGFEAFEAAAFTDVLGFATSFGNEEIEVVTVGLHPELHCTFGFTIKPELLLEDAEDEEFDAIGVPGGFERAGFYNDAYSDAFADIFRRFAAEGKPIAAVCTGALAVARSGVLRGRRATTYHLLEGKRRRQLADMGAIVIDSALVRDGMIVTSASPATAIDVAFTLLEMLTSVQNATATRHAMGFV
ncbi:MAG: DJ-1/PfpI family protein [Dehalococcoidia bacterium]|nr:DJ-1/PfpI family protein [Dehalococcoidia bacterium]